MNNNAKLIDRCSMTIIIVIKNEIYALFASQAVIGIVFSTLRPVISAKKVLNLQRICSVA